MNTYNSHLKDNKNEANSHNESSTDHYGPVTSSGYVWSNEEDSYRKYWLSVLEIWNRQAFSVSQPATVISQLILKFKRR